MIAGRIRVLVLHNDPIARAGLAVALESSTEIEVRTGVDHPVEGGRRAGSEPYPEVDVIVADYVSGLDVVRRTNRQRFPPGLPRLVVVGGMDREWEIRTALELGVKGYLLPGHGVDALIESVRAVHRGMRYLEPQVVERLAESFVLDPLTRREEDVLRLVVDGLCNKAIAARLGIAVGTVKSHLKTIFGKLGVGSRTQAVAAVGRRGVLRQVEETVPVQATGGRSRASARTDYSHWRSPNGSRRYGATNAASKHPLEERP